MFRFVLATASIMLVGATVSAALAQQNVINTRQALMKQSGQQTAVLNRMVRGQEAFDATKVGAAFDALADKAAKMPGLFPEESRKGETRAHPKIWEDSAGFKAAVASFASDVASARPKALTGLDGLKEALPAVAKHCGTCHETYRLPRS